MDTERIRLFTAGLVVGVAAGLFVGMVGIPMWFNLGPYAV
jgi:hypothetical protein